MDKILQTDIEVTKSNGFGASGKQYYFIRPFQKCINRSRKVSGFTNSEIQGKIDRCIEKWFYPKVIMYDVNGSLIGSNCKENALKEYWRICQVNDIGKQFEVSHQLQTPQP